MIVNCKYSAIELHKTMSPALKSAKMKECADDGCIRCRNGYYGSGPTLAREKLGIDPNVPFQIGGRGQVIHGGAVFSGASAELVKAQEALEKAPQFVDDWVSVEPRVLKSVLAYTYADTPNYEDLTETERGLMTEEEFKAMRKWSLREKT